jgi:hypothetical protein
MERRLSPDVATIGALVAECRTDSGQGDIPFDPMEGAKFLAGAPARIISTFLPILGLDQSSF